MNNKDPVFTYFKIIIKNTNLFIFLLLLAVVLTYLTIKSNKLTSVSSASMKYSSSFMQIIPLDPLYFNNSSDFRLNLNDYTYVQFVREYARDFRKKCSMGNYPDKNFIIFDIPGTTNDENYKISLNSVEINYFLDYEDKVEECLKRVFNDFKNYENKMYIKLFKKIFSQENISTQNFSNIDEDNFNNGFETETEITNVQVNYFFLRDIMESVSTLKLANDDRKVFRESLEMLSDQVLKYSKSKILIKFEPMQIFSIEKRALNSFDTQVLKVLAIYIIIFFAIGILLLFINKNLFRLGFINK